MKKSHFFALVATALMANAGAVPAAVLDLSGSAVDQSSVHGGNPSFVGAHAFDNSTANRWAADFPNTQQWLWVDTGADHTLNSITIDWETANATNFTIRTRTSAQGASSIPGDWLVVATGLGVGGLPGGGAVGDDHLFDFGAGVTSDISGTGGTLTVDVSNPVGRYIMFETSDYSTTCCGGPSIWEVRVDANPIPEPSAALPAAFFGGVVILRRGRRRS